MSVRLLAFQCHKERAGSSAARVRTDAVDYERGRSATQFTTDFMGDTLKFCRNQSFALRYAQCTGFHLAAAAAHPGGHQKSTLHHLELRLELFIKFMAGIYQKWMYAWETRLTTRDTNRVVRPLEWGMEWARRWPLV